MRIIKTLYIFFSINQLKEREWFLTSICHVEIALSMMDFIDWLSFKVRREFFFVYLFALIGFLVRLYTPYMLFCVPFCYK